MWIFSKYGFFSTVCDTKHSFPMKLNKDLIMVRARVQGHLEGLQDRFPALKVYSIEGYKPGNDYQCRIYVPKEIWAKIMTELVEELDYGNFKNVVHKCSQETDKLGNYQDLLFDVWNTMFELR